MIACRRAAFVLMLLVAARAALGQEPNTLTTEELDAGWVLLFDGATDFGWQKTSEADWQVADGVVTVGSGEKGLLATTSEFADYEFKADFRAEAGANSGIFLRTPLAPMDPAKDCYELNIAAPSISPFPTGSFVGRQKAAGDQDLTAWHTFHVTAEGAHFVVRVDGETVLDYSDPTPVPRGHIGLQFNSGRVEFRNVKLRPLGLGVIFNGRDLAGWKVYPDKKSVYSVTPEGWLNVKDGDGQLESESQHADFVLQLECRSNGMHLNSGIFFRSIPGDYRQGYECQIQNGYADGDRTKPLDCGTGGFYRRQNARKVVSDDFQWFHLTLVATGAHMAAWVEGIQVSDWTDEREEHENPRQGKRLAAGTLSIQGHDPTTDLSFRNLRIVETQ